MQEILNFEGITSSIWENIQPTEVSNGVHEYILWKGTEGKQSAIYQFAKNTKLDPIDSHKYGEEHIFVISGTFNDGKNNHNEGSYIINPQGTVHIPQSKDGCIVLVTFPNGRDYNL